MSQKLSTPKGTRDFSPQEMNRRNYLMSVIKKHFESFCFEPIETPSFENLSTLMGKYGDEGDRLIFKILNSGEYLKKVQEKDLTSKKYSSITKSISEKALRYDLTIPFARYVVQNRNDITMPFKRYQMQPVWRADRPQKGRYREFYQCDADVVGTNSLWQEVDFIRLYDEVFSELKINATIKLNNRKILFGIVEVIGAQNKIIDITVAIDKLDKIGLEKVKEEMFNKGVSADAIEKLNPLFELKGTNIDKINLLKSFLQNSEIGCKGIEEIEFILLAVDNLPLKKSILEVDVTLARGLDYYTGTIFEALANDVQLGSIGGGGRYDDLTGVFGFKNISGVGISFGLDRIYLVLQELDLFPKDNICQTKLLFVNFGNQEAHYVNKLISSFRSNGVNTEMYPDAIAIKKQMNYANKKQVPFVAIIGEDEMKNGQIILKNMSEGTQEKITVKDFLLKFK